MRSARMMREGLMVGLIGYFAVAVFYAVFDVLAARGTLFTVDMLSRSMFHEAPTIALLDFPRGAVDTAAIFWYNLLHLGTSVAIGLTVVALVEHAERHPVRSRLVAAVLVAGYVATILVVGMLSRSIRPVLPWWTIVTVNTAAVLLGGAYLTQRRPGLPRRLLRLS